MFSTEGHIFPLDKRFRLKPWENKEESKTEEESTRVMSVVNVASNSSFYNVSTCTCIFIWKQISILKSLINFEI